MSASWDLLREQLLPRIRDIAGDAWDDQRVQDFVKRKLDEIAKDAWLAVNSDDADQREVHRQNLEDQWAHVKDEALVALRTQVKSFGERAGEILKAVAGVLLGAVESRLLGKPGA